MDQTAESPASGAQNSGRVLARILIGLLGLISIWWFTSGAEEEWEAMPLVPQSSAALADGPPDAVQLEPVEERTAPRDPALESGPAPAPEAEGRGAPVVGIDPGEASFWIRVVGAENGRPLPGAEVWDVEFADRVGPCADGAGSIEGAAIAISDSNGLALLPLLQETDEEAFSRRAQPRFIVVAAGRARAYVREDGAATTEESAQVVQLREAAVIDVTVTDPSGHPFTGAEVSLAIRDSTGASFRAEDRAAEKLGVLVGFRYVNRAADAAGRVTFGCIPSGTEVRASVLVPELGPRRQHLGTISPVLAPGERRAVTLVAQLPTDLFGVAVDQFGAPATQLEIALVRDEGQFGPSIGFFQTVIRSFTAITSSDGSYRLEGVPAGRWLVVPRQQPPKSGEPLPENAYAPVPTAIELTGTDGQRELNLSLFRDLYLRGVILDVRGNPVLDAIVELRLESGALYAKQRGEADGSFVFGPLPDWRMVLSARDVTGRQASPGIAVRPGEVPVTLHLEPERGR